MLVGITHNICFFFHQLTMEIKIMSKKCIRPSSQTPPHLKNFKLSLLDQLIPAPYAPIVFFYPNKNSATDIGTTQILVILKKSLSETLSRFYPLAGKIKDDLNIDCNDEGALFVEAEVNIHLSDFLKRPDLLSINQFLPCDISFNGSNSGAHVANIQVNIFKCGGIAIGLCISHKVLDGAALASFMKGWANTASGSKQVVYPDFSSTSLFPTNDLWLRDTSMLMWGSLFKMGKSKTKRFVFDGLSIATLKEKSENFRAKNPTRVEAVSAFLWKCTMAASEKKNGSKRPSMLSHIVNLRKKAIPNLPEHSIGNLIWIASAECKVNHDRMGLQGLVGKVREGISRINHEFIKKLCGDEQTKVIGKSLKRMGSHGSKEGVDYFGFTSWCKLGFYEADFGWGKPLWVSGVASSGPVFMNLIVLVETRTGDGIEAWVTLDEEEMVALECDVELLTFASVDPSPLKVAASIRSGA